MSPVPLCRSAFVVSRCGFAGAANLTAPGEATAFEVSHCITAFCLSCEVFASGVHHFCQHDRAFKEAGSFACGFPFDLLLACLFLIQSLMIKDVLA